MKKYISTLVVSSLLLSACTDLSETLYDRVSVDDYGKTSTEVQTIVGGAYASLRGFGADAPESGGIICFPTCEFVFFVEECTSDEACIPTRGTDWYDGGEYQQLERHTWTPSHTKILSAWRYAFVGVSKINAIIYQVDQSDLTDDAKNIVKAELRGLRAYYYWQLLDKFGGVPITTDFTEVGLPENSTRTEVFNFVEAELKEILPLLPATIQYGRFTQNVANALLARLYINAEVYTGTARWQDCLDVCERVSGYTLAPYFDNFKIQNETSPEIIFAIPYDHTQGTTGNYLASMTYHYNQGRAFDPNGVYQWCANGICAQPGVYSSFEEGDIRRNSLLIGQQKSAADGSDVLMDNGEPLNYTEEIGNFENALQNEGARLDKYEWAPNDAWERDNDLVLMRYAEILMMQAECNFRLGFGTAGLPFVNQLRTRAGLENLTELTEEALDEEWLHEFVFEGMRRTINIRFGTFFEAGWSRDATPAYRGVYPVPQEELDKNPALKQNPNY